MPARTASGRSGQASINDLSSSPHLVIWVGRDRPDERLKQCRFAAPFADAGGVARSEASRIDLGIIPLQGRCEREGDMVLPIAYGQRAIFALQSNAAGEIRCHANGKEPTTPERDKIRWL
jgi:hypothetical protein